MKRIAVLATSVLALGLLVQASGATSGDAKILEFETMIGVSGPFLGATNPINGVPGAGAAWQIDSGRGELRVNGALEVEVEGLVLTRTGENPSTNFRAVVACHTVVAGQAATARAVTGPFPATPQGDSKIEAQVDVPSPCFDPAVFVTNAAGDPPRWFAVTGH
ncbi:MAG TPA: hypothetical protein VG144_13815 [Gaiellaceae bacterium]|jgi:hypothetical protein|nr:hypothetical protein [Gaiellaceae bacterium]